VPFIAVGPPAHASIEAPSRKETLSAAKDLKDLKDLKEAGLLKTSSTSPGKV